jgi:phosphatidate cytidylyltransferase
MAGEQMAARAPVAPWAVRAAPGAARTARAVAAEALSGGARPAGAAERPGSLAQRIVSGVTIGAPVVLGAYLGGPWFLLGTGLLGGLGLREFYALTERLEARLTPRLGLLLGLGVLLANGGLALLWQGFAPLLAPLLLSGLRPGPLAPPALLRPGAAGGPGVLPELAGALVVVLPLVALLFERRDPHGRLVGWALTVAGVLYVGWLLSHFQLLRLLGAPGSEAGRGWVFYVFAGTWSYDTGAYLVGRRWGRHRFMTWITPRKTWEGAAGGLVLCGLATLLARSPLPAPLAPLGGLVGWAPLPIPLWHVPLLALALCAAAQAGDLAESMIKREAGAKDASGLIPGHGGMLDRLDSLLFTVVLVYYYAVALGAG